MPYGVKSMRMLLTRIAELLAPFLSCTPNVSGHKPDEGTCILSPTHLNNISTYIDILLRWNARINLTAIRKEEEIVTRHFGESLFAARHLFPRVATTEAAERRQTAAHGASRGSTPLLGQPAPKGQKITGPSFNYVARSQHTARVADLGSGAGFPGIPIKLWAPNISLTLIESNHRKAAFLRELTRVLTFTDIDIQNVRAETLSPSTFEFVTIRAVERLAKILPTAASLLTDCGRLALLVSSSQLHTIATASPCISWSPPLAVPKSHSRLLLIGSKVTELPYSSSLSH
jgi:16S rRNA (guanine527-N7)-methyltransferase